MKRRILFLLCAAMGIAALPARAEILKFAVPQGNSIKFTWWPKLAMPQGWHQEEGPSLHYDAAALAPDGKNFSESDAVLVAKAQAKSGVTSKTLSELIKNDTEGFAAAAPSVTIARTDDIKDADGKVFFVYSFTPANGRIGNWEVTAYGEEGEYFLLFTLSAHSKVAYDKNFPVFRRLVADYAEKLADGK